MTKDELKILLAKEVAENFDRLNAKLLTQFQEALKVEIKAAIHLQMQELSVCPVKPGPNLPNQENSKFPSM